MRHVIKNLIFQAIKHLHDNDLIHLDVKPENILLSMDGVCKLGDFGLVVNLKEVMNPLQELPSFFLSNTAPPKRICSRPSRAILSI